MLVFRRRLLGAPLLLLASVTATRAQTIDLDGIVVTTSRVAGTAIDTLGGATAIGKSQIDQQYQADRVSDIIRTIPGVTTQETARDTAQSINIRGLQDFGRVNVLIDGMRQNFQRSGHSSNGSFYIEPEMIKRVDVTRGPTATIYGSGAIGGVAAFELIDADDVLASGETVGLRLKSRYSTNGKGPFGSASAATRIGNFDLVGQVNGRDVDAYEDGGGRAVANSAEETGSTLARSRWSFAPGHQITGTVLGYRSEFVDSVNEVLTTSNVPRQSAVENRQYNLGYKFARPDAPLIDAALKVYRNETDLQQTTLSGSQSGKRRGFNVVTDGFDASNTSRFDFGGAKIALTYGGDAFTDHVDVFDQNVSSFSAPAFRFTPTGARTVSGAFTQAHVSLWNVVDLIGAVRYDRYELEGGSTSTDGERVSPKMTLGVTPLRGLSVFGTYAEGYRAPHLTETVISGTHAQFVNFVFLPNPGLRPEVAHNGEVGVNLKSDGLLKSNDAFRAKVVAFRNKIDDYIDQHTFDASGTCFTIGVNCTGSTVQYVNIGRATLQGVEAELTYDARSWFLAIGAHRIRGEDDATGTPLATVPADQLTLTLGARMWNDRVVAGARGRLVAAQDRVPTATLASPPYTLVDLFAEYRHAENVTFNAMVDNVFDETYRQYLDQSSSPGLNARFGVTMRFGQ